MMTTTASVISEGMALNEPKWVDACFMQKVLRNIECDDSIEASNVTMKPVVAKGDNYLSDLYRVNVEFLRNRRGQKIAEKESFIVKILPSGDFREDMVLSAEFFTTEIVMALKTLPRMNEILNEIGMTTLAARYYHVQYEQPIHLVIEDLASRGFQMADRQAGLDLEHCLIAFRKIAAFHASSVALQEKDPKALMEHRRGLFHKDHPSSLTAFFNASTKALGEEVAKWSELNPRISEKILKLSDDLYLKASESILLQENDFNVLNHGDSWVNNMMFHYDEQQKPIDLIFVDFQMSRYGSPAIDLLYFLGTSPSDNLREHKRQLLLHEYHNSLTSTMTKLKCNTKAPSFEKLQAMLHERAFYEVVASFTVLPLVLVDKSEQKSLDEIMRTDGTYENFAYQNKLYRKVMTRVLPLYDSMGLLDF